MPVSRLSESARLLGGRARRCVPEPRRLSGLYRTVLTADPFKLQETPR